MSLPVGVSLEQAKEYALLEIDLAVERKDVKVVCEGDILTVVFCQGELHIRIHEIDNPKIDLRKVTRINVRPLKFRYIYLTNPVQTGLKALLCIGREASFEAIPYTAGEVQVLDAVKAVINPAKEDGNLALIKSQTDKLTFDVDNILKVLVEKATITVPVDLQAILEKKTELYGADETADQSIELDTGGYKTVEFQAKATVATTFKVEYSFDGAKWYTYYSSPSPETEYNDVVYTAARYFRLSSTAAGATGDTVDLIIGAKP